MSPNTLVAMTTSERFYAEVFQGLTNQLLGLAFGIDVGGVDEVDACSERRFDQLGAFALLKGPDGLPHSLPTERHSAEADFGHVEACAAELVIAHGMAPEGRGLRASP